MQIEQGSVVKGKVITIYFQEEKPCKRFMILPMKK